MAKIVLRTTVGTNGAIQLQLPPEKFSEGQLVEVTISLDRSKMTQEEYLAFIHQFAGSIDDPTFIRHPQGELETRNTFE